MKTSRDEVSSCLFNKENVSFMFGWEFFFLLVCMLHIHIHSGDTCIGLSQIQIFFHIHTQIKKTQSAPLMEQIHLLAVQLPLCSLIRASTTTFSAVCVCVCMSACVTAALCLWSATAEWQEAEQSPSMVLMYDSRAHCVQPEHTHVLPHTAVHIQARRSLPAADTGTHT